jgi:hypothetical protein
MPNRPSPASESGVLRVDGAAATPSRSPKGNDRGHGMGGGWGSVGSAYEIGGARRGRVWGTWGINASSLGESARIRRSVCKVLRGVGAVGGRGVSNACTAVRVESWCSRWGVRRS